METRQGAIANRCYYGEVVLSKSLRFAFVWALHITQVVQSKTEESEGYTALQVGIGAKRSKQVPATLRGHFTAAGLPILRKLAEFRVTADALLPVGTDLPATLFVPGQFVDVVGTTIGKGFQGVMKKWNFRGQPASHGASLAHRVPGSTGSNQVSEGAVVIEWIGGIASPC